MLSTDVFYITFPPEIMFAQPIDCAKSTLLSGVACTNLGNQLKVVLTFTT